MATHNPKRSRSTCKNTLLYIYRGKGHEHKVDLVIHLGGNLLSADPIERDTQGNVVTINIDNIQIEFENQAALHRGKGELLYKHYVISLAPGEHLEKHEWMQMINEYMHALGFDEGTRWTAVQHNDSESKCEHVHILACLVKTKTSGPLISTHNDYEKGWAVMRKFEQKFGLTKVENPDNTFGKDFKKGKIKSYGTREVASQFDEASIIRARFNALYKENGKPRTMSQLVEQLLKRDVFVKVSTTPDGVIKGISYRAGIEGAWISGSKIKATRFTWTALQNKEKISYWPERDDGALGICDSIVEIKIKFKKKLPPQTLEYLNITQDFENRYLIYRYHRKRHDDTILLELIKTLILIILMLFGIRVSLEETSFNISPFNEQNNETINTAEDLNLAALEAYKYQLSQKSELTSLSYETDRNHDTALGF